MKRSNFLKVLSLTTFLALAGCTNTTPTSSGADSATSEATSSNAGSSSSEASSSETVSSSEESSSSLASKRLELTLGKTTITAGTSFFECCNPTLIWIDGSTSKDLSAYFNFINWVITDSAGTVYKKDQILTEPGKYSVQATYTSKSKKSETLEFTVESGNVETAAEGKGYKTVSVADSEKYAIGQYDGIGALGKGKFPTIGVKKLLVVPVQFANAGTNVFGATDIEMINNAYFGAASSTGWQSLASYYDTSSYGKLTLEGTVTTPFTYSMDAATFETSGSSTAVARAAVTYAEGLGYDMKDYDGNGDGYVDGIELIYKTSRPNKSQGGKDIWWNYTTVTGDAANPSDPTAYRYFWSLFDYIKTGYYTPDIDCHTLIHESGHMMGLNDYYSYDTNPQGPAGCVDMMDMNVGDHNAYSKFMYGWVTPKVIDGSSSNFEITLNSYTESGDCILLRNTTTDPWNGTPYDEYLMLQYYTPTGLNAKDSTGYPEWTANTSLGHGGTYEKPGLQVFHVNNRLGAKVGTYTGTASNPKIVTSKYAYVDVPSNVNTYNDDGTFVEASSQLTSNTAKDSSRAGYYIDDDGNLMSIAANQGVWQANIRELTCMPANGSTSFLSGSYYSNFGSQKILLGTSEYDCGGTDYTNYMMMNLLGNGTTWDDGSKLNWDFQVVGQTDGTITLHFVEL